MAWESVDFFIVSKSSGTPIEGVLTRVYNSDGTEVFTEGTSDAAGRVSLLLPVGVFTARFYKFGVSFEQPQVVEVLTPLPGELSYNSFNVEVTLLAPSLSTDPRLCRCSGYFRELTGAPKPYLDLHFTPDFKVTVLQGDAVVAGVVAIRTDEKGFVSIDLIRGAMYRVTMENLEGDSRLVRVPDSPSCNISSLIFPVVALVQFDVPSDSSVVVGEVLSVTPVVTDSAKVPLQGTASADVIWSLSDPAVAKLGVTDYSLEITGVKPGITKLLVERRDKSIILVPDAGIYAPELLVTVA